MRKNTNYFGLNKHSFQCTVCNNDDTDELFCMPKHCRKQINQQAIPSANSSFSLDELEKITECINLANQLLLTLALNDEENLRALQESLRDLRGNYAHVEVNCPKEKQIIEGKIIDAGRNFLMLASNTGNTIFIPFENILFITRINNNSIEMNQELIKIDSCLRRNLTLNFSETVSKSPYLLNLFYGIELSVLLESYVDCFVYVKSSEEKLEHDGKLVRVNKRRVIVNRDDELIGIDFDEICYIEIENGALTRCLA